MADNSKRFLAIWNDPTLTGPEIAEKLGLTYKSARQTAHRYRLRGLPAMNRRNFRPIKEG